MENIKELREIWDELVKTAPEIDLNLSCDATRNVMFVGWCISFCKRTIGEIPFKSGTELYNKWSDLQYFYDAWRNNSSGGNCAYKKRFVKILAEIIAANPEFPFETAEEKPIAAEDRAIDVPPVEVDENSSMAEVEPVVETRAQHAEPVEPKVEETVVNDPPHKIFNTFRKGGRRNQNG